MSTQSNIHIENGLLTDGNHRIVLAQICGYRAETHALIISSSHRDFTMNVRPGEAERAAELLDKWFAQDHEHQKETRQGYDLKEVAACLRNAPAPETGQTLSSEDIQAARRSGAPDSPP